MGGLAVYDALADAWKRVDALPDNISLVPQSVFDDVYMILVKLPWDARVAIANYVENANVFSKDSWKKALGDLMEQTC